MPKITYNGDGLVEWFGVSFRPNVAVDLDEVVFQHPGLRDQMLTKAQANPFFDVSGADDAGDDEDEGFGSYTVKRKGRGKYAVFQGDDVIAEGLTKAEAEAHAKDLADAEAAEHQD
jgi:hypothetical protein